MGGTYKKPELEPFHNEAESGMILDRTYFAWGCGPLMASDGPTAGLTQEEIGRIAQDAAAIAQAISPPGDVTIHARYAEVSGNIPALASGPDVDPALTGQNLDTANALLAKVDQLRQLHPAATISLRVKP